jgi:hypothetical protein
MPVVYPGYITVLSILCPLLHIDISHTSKFLLKVTTLREKERGKRHRLTIPSRGKNDICTFVQNA